MLISTYLFTAIRYNKVKGGLYMKRNTVRLTIDFPVDQHMYIKMLAAKEGVSLRSFVIEHKSIGKVFLGVLKVVSYATIALPIIFGLGYFYASSQLNKLSSLYNRVTELESSI